MKSTDSADDGDERFRRLYQRYRREGIKYAAALIAGPDPRNKYILGVEAEEMFDEAMELYWRNGEHVTDHSEHGRHIKARIFQVFVDWVRRANTQKRKAPGPTVSLDAMTGSRVSEEADVPLDPADPRSRHAEEEVDIEDALGRLASEEEQAARARLRDDTYEEIAQDAGISEEGARKRVKRAGEQLKKAFEEDP